tara:strand:- start:83 stop:391 length:309 start_codon:yes stop_codon:yes gene_type:complete
MELKSILGEIEANKAKIKRLQKEIKDLQNMAVATGHYTWTYTRNGELATKFGVIGSEKAPSRDWWQKRRPRTYEILCEKAKDRSHPDHSAFWKKPTLLFSVA